MKTTYCRISATILSVFLMSLPALATQWSIQTVDSMGNVGARTSLALNASGIPSIAYRDYSNHDLKYAIWNDPAWQIQTVDSVGWAGDEASLVLDNSSRPHISYKYFDQWNHNLKYAAWDGSAWQTETVDSSPNVGHGSSLALDGSGMPHISYLDGYPNYCLRYASWEGSSWQIRTVDGSGDVGGPSSLVLDGSGRPHIAYQTFVVTGGGYDYTQKYAAWNGSAWQIQTVGSAGKDMGSFTSLALDASGRPHMAYYSWYNGSNADLNYAVWDGSAWHTEIVDGSIGDQGRYLSLALDNAGRPRISYQDYSPNWDLKYAAWNGSAWEIETVDSIGGVGSFTSLALDASGLPHISYYDSTNGNLKFAEAVPEPATLSLLALGALAFMRRRR